MSPVRIPSAGADSQFHEEVKMYSGPAPRIAAKERRRQQRFPIIARSRYLLEGAGGFAVTANISSGGVLLETKEILPAGRPVQVWIDWPALLYERCPLRLVLSGHILRSNITGTAVEITRYCFRLRPKSEGPFAG